MNLRQELSTLQKTGSDNFIVIPGASELLLHLDVENNPWPKDILINDRINTEQILRNNLSKTLETIFTTVPFAQMNLFDALEQKLISVDIVNDLLNQFSELLETDTYTKQLVLYIPFEMIPEKSWVKKYPILKSSISLFRKTYAKKWYALLKQKVPRANFIDGDVLETGMYDQGLPFVAKAAHLIPFLLQKELVSLSEIIEIIETSTDAVLQESIIDTIPTLFSMNLVTNNNVKQMLQSSNQQLRNICIVAKQSVSENHTPVTSDWITVLIKKLNTKLQSIQAEYENQVGTCTESRRIWKKKSDEKAELEKRGVAISQVLLNDLSLKNNFQEFIAKNTDIVSQKLAILVIRNLVEQLAVKGRLSDAHMIKNEFSDYLQDMEQNSYIGLRNSLETLWYRWNSLGLISKLELSNHNLQPVQLFTESIVSNMHWYPEAKQLASIGARIASDKQFSDYIYPVCIMYGSSVKGYADKNADIDIAVFVKPDVPFSKRSHVQEIIGTLFKETKSNGKALEFWTKENSNKLIIQDFEIEDRFLGKSVMSHVLFHGIWCGNRESIQLLYQDLLSPYIYEQDKLYYGHPIREAYTSELERDALQYRLMHKGYYRFYPNQNPLSSSDSKDIDADSAFWDPGYRRIATKLFVDKLFLPVLIK